jgi:hypothetical protein
MLFFLCQKSFLSSSQHPLFGEVGPHSNEDVILHLIKFKCICRISLYGIESCPLAKADVQSLDFTLMRFLMKNFKSSNSDFVLNCIGYFNISIHSDLNENRQANFVAKLDKV